MNALIDAQAQYLSQHHDGVKHNTHKDSSATVESKTGSTGRPPMDSSPLGPLVASAASDGFTPQAGKQQPFHGYLYRIVDKQGADAKGGTKDFITNGKMTGGFAFIAYPEAYGDTGITTFITNQSGVVYEKDLGKDTAAQARTTTEFNPDKSWTKVPE
jgi:Protein of unknown function (DUF2950)